MADVTRCEHRNRDLVPCTAKAIFSVSYGTRRHDTQKSCRRHLAATVETLAQGTSSRIIATLLHAPIFYVL
jgi:hypothetical protein